MLISYNVANEELRIVDMKRLRSITIHRAYYSTGKVNRSVSNSPNELVIPDSLFEDTFDILKTYNRSLLRNQGFVSPNLKDYAEILEEELINMISIVMKDNIWPQIHETPSFLSRQRILDRGLAF